MSSHYDSEIKALEAKQQAYLNLRRTGILAMDLEGKLKRQCESHCSEAQKLEYQQLESQPKTSPIRENTHVSRLEYMYTSSTFRFRSLWMRRSRIVRQPQRAHV